MARLVARGGLEIRITGITELMARAQDDRFLRRPIRKALRAAGKLMKAEYVTVARPISRRLARRVRVKIKQGAAPAYIPQDVAVTTRYAGGPAIVSGRRAGAKLPPVRALRGGFAAARAVAERGLPGHPFLPAVVRAVGPPIERSLATAAREMERQWQG